MKKRNKNIIIIAVLILIFSAIAIVFTHFYSKNKIEQIEKEALETKKQELTIRTLYQACHGYMSAGRPPYLCRICDLSGYNTS